MKQCPSCRNFIPRILSGANVWACDVEGVVWYDSTNTDVVPFIISQLTGTIWEGLPIQQCGNIILDDGNILAEPPISLEAAPKQEPTLNTQTLEEPQAVSVILG